MIPKGLYPALITPFLPDGRLDHVTVAQLIAWHQDQGCQGAVLAGSNGEGASLSATERRDLLKEAKLTAGPMKLIFGLPTSSIDDVRWGLKQAASLQADAVLLSPPSFFRRAPEEGVARWIRQALDWAETPVILYHNPPVFGVPLPLEWFEELASHPSCGGVKNSAADPALFAWMSERLKPDQAHFVGDETLLAEALNGGANGSISGAANVVPLWLSQIISRWPSEDAQVKLELLMPVLKAIRSHPQPETHKSVLAGWGLIPSREPRLPLMAQDGVPVADLIKQVTGYPAGS